MKVVRPAAQAAVHIFHDVPQGDGGQVSCRQIRQPRLDFLQRFIGWPNIRVRFSSTYPSTYSFKRKYKKATQYSHRSVDADDQYNIVIPMDALRRFVAELAGDRSCTAVQPVAEARPPEASVPASDRGSIEDETGNETMENIDIDGTLVAIDRTLVSAPILGAMAKKQYEHVEARIGTALLQEPQVTGGQVLLEIGAGLGFVGSCLFKTGKIARIEAYEANPNLIPLIRETHRLNGVVSRVCNAIVDGEASGDTTDFFVPADFWAASTRPRSSAERISCPHRSLDEVIRELNPTLLMVDIEGGEQTLFSNVESLGTIERILIEIHQPMIGRAGILRFFSDMVRLGFVYDQKYSTGKVLVLQRQDMPL